MPTLTFTDGAGTSFAAGGRFLQSCGRYGPQSYCEGMAIFYCKYKYNQGPLASGVNVARNGAYYNATYACRQ